MIEIFMAATYHQPICLSRWINSTMSGYFQVHLIFIAKFELSMVSYKCIKYEKGIYGKRLVIDLNWNIARTMLYIETALVLL